MQSDIQMYEIDQAIQKGVNYLVLNQHDDGSIYLENETRWQIWETANAIITVNKVDNEKKTFLKNGIQYLLDVQKDDGSFYYTKSMKPEEYCMETTAIALLALDIEDKNVETGIDFLVQKQLKDGSWDIGTPGITKRRRWPSVTGFVLNTLLQLKASDNVIQKGIDFITKQQHFDGSWGTNWVYYDTPYYPIYIILSTLKLYGLQEKVFYQQAVNFVIKNQQKNGSWNIKTTDKPRPSASLRTSLALYSLLLSPSKVNKEIIGKGMKWLIQQQKSNGSWDGGYFVNWPGKKEDIFTTSLALQSLKKYSNIH